MRSRLCIQPVASSWCMAASSPTPPAAARRALATTGGLGLDLDALGDESVPLKTALAPRP